MESLPPTAARGASGVTLERHTDRRGAEGGAGIVVIDDVYGELQLSSVPRYAWGTHDSRLSSTGAKLVPAASSMGDGTAATSEKERTFLPQ